MLHIRHKAVNPKCFKDQVSIINIIDVFHAKPSSDLTNIFFIESISICSADVERLMAHFFIIFKPL